MGDLFVQHAAGKLRPSEGFLRFVREQKLTHLLITTNDFEPPLVKLSLDLANTGLGVVYPEPAAVILKVHP